MGGQKRWGGQRGQGGYGGYKELQLTISTALLQAFAPVLSQQFKLIKSFCDSFFLTL